MVHSNSYFSYYSDSFKCVPFFSQFKDILQESYQSLSSLGYSDSDIEKLKNSGFIAIENRLLIDKYYGGYLSSGNLTCRFTLNKENINSLLNNSIDFDRRIIVHEAYSVEEVKEKVAEIEKQYNKDFQFVYRGQAKHYSFKRDIPNPYFVNSMLGETSLFPSGWRRILSNYPNALCDFNRLSLFELSSILYGSFDTKLIDDEIIKGGQYPGLISMTELAEHENPIVSEFGKIRLEVNLFSDNILAASIMTLLQHYGFYSTVLDVSTDIETALFFATHRFEHDISGSRYISVGANNNSSIIYIFLYDKKEMEKYFPARSIILEKYNPLRPKKQKCTVIKSSPLAMNLPGDHLVGAIRLVGNNSWDLPFNCADLFPSQVDDPFLKLLKECNVTSKYVTDFY